MKFDRKQMLQQVAMYKQRMPKIEKEHDDAWEVLPIEAEVYIPPKPKFVEPAVGSMWHHIYSGDCVFTVKELDKPFSMALVSWKSPNTGDILKTWIGYYEFEAGGDGPFTPFTMENE